MVLIGRTRPTQSNMQPLHRILATELGCSLCPKKSTTYPTRRLGSAAGNILSSAQSKPSEEKHSDIDLRQCRAGLSQENARVETAGPRKRATRKSETGKAIAAN